MIERGYDTDPLVCPKCQASMTIAGFIEPDQPYELERILRQAGRWEETPGRDPPEAS